jgi:hypothetical protein
MSSYPLMMFILLFGGAILIGATSTSSARPVAVGLARLMMNSAAMSARCPATGGVPAAGAGDRMTAYG